MERYAHLCPICEREMIKTGFCHLECPAGHYQEVCSDLFQPERIVPENKRLTRDQQEDNAVTLPTDKSEGFCGTHGFTTPTLTHKDPSDPLRSTETAIERHQQYSRVRSIMQERLIFPGIKAGALRWGTVNHYES